jgi:hypothetical protein
MVVFPSFHTTLPLTTMTRMRKKMMIAIDANVLMSQSLVVLRNDDQHDELTVAVVEIRRRLL